MVDVSDDLHRQMVPRRAMSTASVSELMMFVFSVRLIASMPTVTPASWAISPTLRAKWRTAPYVASAGKPSGIACAPLPNTRHVRPHGVHPFNGSQYLWLCRRFPGRLRAQPPSCRPG